MLRPIRLRSGRHSAQHDGKDRRCFFFSQVCQFRCTMLFVIGSRGIGFDCSFSGDPKHRCWEDVPFDWQVVRPNWHWVLFVFFISVRIVLLSRRRRRAARGRVSLHKGLCRRSPSNWWGNWWFPWAADTCREFRMVLGCWAFCWVHNWAPRTFVRARESGTNVPGTRIL
jgi:hypothetical protein